GVANERGDHIAAREHAADDLAADAAGGADHRRGHRVSFRSSSISSAAERTCFRGSAACVIAVRSLLSDRAGRVSLAPRRDETRDRAGAYRPPESLIHRLVLPVQGLPLVW